MPLVFLSPFKKTYKSDICSLSTITGLVLLIVSILLPFFAVISTEDFWLRYKEYTEQPLVDDYNNYMLYISNYNTYRTYFYSSSKELNDKFKNICDADFQNINNCKLLQNCFFSSSPTDLDEDGINDKLTLNYEISSENILTERGMIDIKLMFFLKYGLTKKVKLLMTPMVYINLPLDLSNAKGKEIILNGDLELVQKSPIASTAVTNRVYYYEHPFKVDPFEASYFDLLYHYNKYRDNNYTVKYNYDKIEKMGNENKIIIKIEINIPKIQEVFYIESVFEALKYAWMQYFYIFLPIYIALYILFKFIIQNNIFYSHSKSDL